MNWNMTKFQNIGLGLLLLLLGYVNAFTKEKLNGVSHIAISVVSLEQSRRFYIEVMGGMKVDKLSTDGIFGDKLYYSMYQHVIDKANGKLAEFGICDIKDSGSQELAWDFILFDSFMIQTIQCQKRGTNNPVNFFRVNTGAAMHSGAYSHIAFWMDPGVQGPAYLASLRQAQTDTAQPYSGFQTFIPGYPPTSEDARKLLPPEQLLYGLGPGAAFSSGRGPSGEKVEFSHRSGPIGMDSQLKEYCQYKGIHKDMLPAEDRKETSTVPTQKVTGLHHISHTVKDSQTVRRFYTEVVGAKLSSSSTIGPGFFYGILFQDDEYEALARNVDSTSREDMAKAGILTDMKNEGGTTVVDLDFLIMDNMKLETYAFRGNDDNTRNLVALTEPQDRNKGPGFVRSMVTAFWLFEDEDFDTYSKDFEAKAASNGFSTFKMNRADGGNGDPNSEALNQGDLNGLTIVYFEMPGGGGTNALVQFRGAARNALEEAYEQYGAISVAFDDVNPFKKGLAGPYCCGLNVTLSADGLVDYCNGASQIHMIPMFASVALAILVCTLFHY